MNNIERPIFVTGVERSGATIIARMLQLGGCWFGKTNNMLENFNIIYSAGKPTMIDGSLRYSNDSIDANLFNTVSNICNTQGYSEQKLVVKGSQLAINWKSWNHSFPNAKWVIVRRRTPDIINSCIKTGYMGLFKDPANLKKIEAQNEYEGWLWWVHMYEQIFVEMIQAGLNVQVVWPERIVRGDYTQTIEMFEWLGVKWNNSIISKIDPILTKGRELLYGTGDSN